MSLGISQGQGINSKGKGTKKLRKKKKKHLKWLGLDFPVIF